MIENTIEETILLPVKEEAVDISKYRRYQLSGLWREFSDRYEYIHIKDYEDCLVFSTLHSIALGDVFVQLLEVTETFKAYKTLIDHQQSKDIQLDKTKDGKAVTYNNHTNYNAQIIYNNVPIDHIPVLFFKKSEDVVISNGNVILCDYIAPYKDMSLGFYQGLYEPNIESIPISFLLDMDTPIYISVQMRLDGSKFCVITYNYVINNDF